MIDPRIVEIAYKTRRWAEACGRRSYFGSTLVGFCAKGSARLHANLGEAGFSAQIGLYDDKLYEDSDVGGSHAFVMIQEHVVDITATQFGLQPVEIVPFGHKAVQPFWHANFVFDRLEDFLQHIHNWPHYQRPKPPKRRK